MASTTYQIQTISGPALVRRAVRQGPPAKAESQLRRNQFTVNLTDAEMAEFLSAEKRSGLRHSEFWSLVMWAGLRELFNGNNCSKS